MNGLNVVCFRKSTSNFHKKDKMMGTRAEHLAWCKHRALVFLDIGDIVQAFFFDGK